jgi:membrane dipeptidase
VSGALHDDAIVIDGLEIARWGRPTFESMHRAGLTAVNCTCCVWEGFEGTMANISAFRGWISEHADILRPVRTSADILAAKRENRVGVILGWQNTSAIEDRLSNLELFSVLGVRIAQLTYNTQNYAGSGCFEAGDAGLSLFGHDLVSELNRLGILIDLSHVGPQTSADVIRHSQKPVVYTHTCPAGVHDHVRNKTDAELRAIADQGGVVGITILPWFLGLGDDATLDNYLDAVEYAVDVAGEEHIGIGTDFIEGQDRDWLEWVVRDKGYGKYLMQQTIEEFQRTPMPLGIREIGDFPNVTAAMESRKWSEERIRRIMGENWLRVFKDVWCE